MEIVDQFDYDGIDLDWEYPDTKEEVVGFERLTRRFRKAGRRAGQKKGRPMVVTMAASSNPGTLKWLDKAFLLETMDWINVMTYDFTGDWTNFAGHHSPLFASSKQPGEPAVDGIVHEVPARGTRPAREPAGGGDPPVRPRLQRRRAVCLDQGRAQDSASRGQLQPISTSSRTSPDWTRKWDDETKNPWLISTKGTVVIGYDDAESVAIKTEWAMKQGFRGVFFWQINADRLPDGTNPLQEASKRELDKAMVKGR